MWLFAALLAACAAATVANASMPCDQARMRCAYRTGCGAALSNYMMMCEPVLADRNVTSCSEECVNALIALTSTEEGKQLMNCECEDDYCLETKERINICRPQVENVPTSGPASCTLSQLICIADAQCATALEYYQKYCKSLFTRRGTKCSSRCRNSIHILRKQEKAAPLTACQCDVGDYRCSRTQDNIARYCFHKMKNHTRTHQRHGDRYVKRPNETEPEEHKTSTAHTVQVTGLMLLMCVSGFSFIT